MDDPRRSSEGGEAVSMPSSRRLFKLACFEPLALFLRQLLGGAAVRLELLAFDASLLLGLLRNDETTKRDGTSGSVSRVVTRREKSEAARDPSFRC